MRLTVLLVLLGVGCGGDKKPAETAPSTTPSATTSAAPANTSRQPIGANLTVTDDIFRACHLDVQSDLAAAPKFAFDESLITKADALVLDKIAVCLTTGPLANRHLRLTGRADSRGTEEYNLSLGARRAHGVSSYLEQHKVHGSDLNETSRGALDATGADEPTWAKDRRVDIALVP